MTAQRTHLSARILILTLLLLAGLTATAPEARAQCMPGDCLTADQPLLEDDVPEVTPDESARAFVRIAGTWAPRRSENTYLRLSGSGGRYAGTLVAPTTNGGQARLTIRNLRLTHSSSWQSYEGEIDCEDYGRGGWQDFDLTYYDRDRDKISIVWGCTIADPPDMYRR